MSLFNIGKPKQQTTTDQNPQTTTDQDQTSSDQNEKASTTAYSAGDADHLDNISLDGAANDMGEDDGPAIQAAPDRIDKDVFYLNLAGTLSVAGAMTGLKSLPIADQEKDTARAASDELYDAIAATPYLDWLLSPQTGLLKSIGVIAAFAVPKAIAVKGELSERRAASRPAQKRPANENDPLGGLPKHTGAKKDGG